MRARALSTLSPTCQVVLVCSCVLGAFIKRFQTKIGALRMSHSGYVSIILGPFGGAIPLGIRGCPAGGVKFSPCFSWKFRVWSSRVSVAGQCPLKWSLWLRMLKYILGNICLKRRSQLIRRGMLTRPFLAHLGFRTTATAFWDASPHACPQRFSHTAFDRTHS